MRKINSRFLLLIIFFAAMILTVGFPAKTRADSCPLFSETFSGTSGYTWFCGSQGICTIKNARFEMTQPESDFFSYGETSFMPTGFFTIDTDVTVTPLSANSEIGIYTWTTGDVLFSISNVAADGFAAFYYPQTSQVNFLYWDVSAGEWISTQNQAVTGPVTSIGMKVLSDRVVFRVNRADTGIILPGIFTMPEVIDSLWLMASGSYSLVSFDNVCAFLNSTPPTPTPTPIALAGPGWNLISLPQQPSDTANSSVLGSISGKYASAWAYQNDAWKVFDPANPGFSDLSTMEAGWGYWLNMTEAATLSVTGTEPSKTINLITGWNLVGYNSLTPQNISDALSSIAGKVISVWVYINNSWQFYDPVNPGFSDLTTMSPGYGYWINTNAACTWTLP